MIRRLIVGAAILLLLVSMVPSYLPASAQSSGSPQVSLVSQYRITIFGYAILNETLTFTNNSTATEQVPSVQLGIPDNVSSHAVGYYLTPAGQFTETSNDVDGVTIFTISPVSSSLAEGAISTVSLKSYLSGVLNITAGTKTNWDVVLLLSPTLNEKVTTLTSTVFIPHSTSSLAPVPTIGSEAFNATLTTNPPSYTYTASDITPTIKTETSVFNDTAQASFLPIQVFSVYRTIVPSTNGLPEIQDQVTLRNLAYYSISTLPVVLLISSLTTVTVIPSTVTPTINPTAVNLTSGSLTLSSSPFSGAIQKGDNFTFTMTYKIPKSMVVTSGSTVTVNLPYLLPIEAPVQSYTVTVATPAGVSSVGPSSVHVSDASPITPGNVTVAYRINTGWGADEAIPIASLFAAGVFLLMVVRGSSATSEEEEEEEEGEGKKETSTKLADVIKALEDKIAVMDAWSSGIAGKKPGSVPRADFLKTRSELDSLKSRALHRLNEAKQATDSKRLLDVLNQILEAERDEDRAAKDLINLYEQYQGRKMPEETFQRLLPNYRKRLSSATNRVSDLLNMAQKESVEG